MLHNVEIAVKNKSLAAETYAYLFDRIKMRNGEKQFYGTQIVKIDKKNEPVFLSPVWDSLNLDERRMKMGMEPIKLYKKKILEFL